jgi:hypothetical protein
LPRSSPAVFRTGAFTSALANHTFDICMAHLFQNSGAIALPPML